MQRIKAFICYSSKDENSAIKISEALEKYLGFDIFVSKKRLQLSDNFYKEIWNNLIASNFFIPIISRGFLVSSFANQELGVAIARGVRIIPISIDGTDPNGLIYYRHAYKCRGLEIEDLIKLSSEVFNVPLKHPKCKQFSTTALDGLTYAFANSNCFKTTSIILSIMKEVHKFTKLNDAQLAEIKKGAVNNPEIYKATILFPILKEFLQRNYNIIIDK